MYSKRQNKVARLLQKELAELLDTTDFKVGKNAIVTVTMVRVSPDLSLARIFLSIFALGQSINSKEDAGQKDSVLESINTRAKEIRTRLGNKIRHQVRIIPEISFYLDDSLDYEENIDNLLKGKKDK
jgi:ribosome-binding factor A